jgi:hypothetical protein
MSKYGRNREFFDIINVSQKETIWESRKSPPQQQFNSEDE